MSSQTPNPARLEFARRLRKLRVIRGFKTARSMAAALAIDENRYTRYERAEVEPDIGLIHRICQLLDLSPNELFGIGDEPPARWPAAAERGELAEPGARYGDAADADGRNRRAKAIWRLACAVAQLRSNVNGQAADGSSLARLQQAARLFLDLELRPYATVSELLLLPEVAGASAEQAQQIGRLVEELTEVAA